MSRDTKMRRPASSHCVANVHAEEYVQIEYWAQSKKPAATKVPSLLYLYIYRGFSIWIPAFADCRVRPARMIQSIGFQMLYKTSRQATEHIRR